FSTRVSNSSRLATTWSKWKRQFSSYSRVTTPPSSCTLAGCRNALIWGAAAERTACQEKGLLLSLAAAGAWEAAFSWEAGSSSGARAAGPAWRVAGVSALALATRRPGPGAGTGDRVLPTEPPVVLPAVDSSATVWRGSTAGDALAFAALMRATS